MRGLVDLAVAGVVPVGLACNDPATGGSNAEHVLKYGSSVAIGTVKGDPSDASTASRIASHKGTG